MSTYTVRTKHLEAEPALATVPIPSSLYDTAPAWWTSGSMLLVDILALSTIYWATIVGRDLITPVHVIFYLEVYPSIILFVVAFAIRGLYPGVLLHPAEEMRRVFIVSVS